MGRGPAADGSLHRAAGNCSIRKDTAGKGKKTCRRHRRSACKRASGQHLRRGGRDDVRQLSSWTSSRPPTSFLAHSGHHRAMPQGPSPVRVLARSGHHRAMPRGSSPVQVLAHSGHHRAMPRGSSPVRVLARSGHSHLQRAEHPRPGPAVSTPQNDTPQRR